MSSTEFEQSDPSRLAHLLSMDMSCEDLCTDEELTQIWLHQLDTAIEVDLHDLDSDARRELQRLNNDQQPFTFARLFTDPKPSLPMLHAVKRFARRLAKDPLSGMPREISSMLYIVSIALTYVRCDLRITRLDDRALTADIRWALSKPWLDEGCRSPLRLALERLAPPKSP